MSWNNILKADACVSETKEVFHDFLQKLGANNELLEGLKNANGEELREMIEDIMRTSKHDSHKQVCKKLLRSWDICILEAERGTRNEYPYTGDWQTKLASDVSKSLKRTELHPIFIEYLSNNLTEPRTSREINDMLFTALDLENQRRIENKGGQWKVEPGKIHLTENHRKLSSRVIPERNTLPMILNRHPNIVSLGGKGNRKQFVWRD